MVRSIVIVFGNESADSGGFQVGIRVSRALGRPMVNAIKGVEISDDGSTLEARRETDNGFEVYQLPMPCAIGVKEGITWPRYPTMRGRLASKKLAVDSVSSDAAPGGQTMIRLNRPEEKVSETIILGERPRGGGQGRRTVERTRPLVRRGDIMTSQRKRPVYFWFA